MKTNIDINNLKNSFFLETQTPSNLQYKNKNTHRQPTKLVHCNFASKNEILVSERIRMKIPNYQKYFYIIEEYESVNERKLSNGREIIEKLEESNRKDAPPKFFLCKYRTFDLEGRKSFHEFLFRSHNTKRFLFHLIHSFSQLLNSISKLQNANICFFDLTPDHIVFHKNHVQLIEFHNSIMQQNPCQNSYMLQILSSITSYTHKPIEVHILFYFKNPGLKTISYSFIEEVSEIFVKNTEQVGALLEDKECYKNKCIESLKKYVNQPREAIVAEILRNTNKWDIYAVSLLYLHILLHFVRIFSLNEFVLNRWIELLRKNIHPDPEKRDLLKDFIEKADTIFDSGREYSWDFANELDESKWREFVDTL